MSAQAAPFQEYQVKAVFLFNFAQFVEWPPAAFASADAPLVIGVLGENPFGAFLDETVRSERVGTRPLAIQRYHHVDEIDGCAILFISRSEADRVEQILDVLQGRPILIVGDSHDFTQRGGMIRFATVQHKIRLFINVAAAQAANLTISSKLLRAAEIVTASKK
jgi:hypothetical protein